MGIPADVLVDIIGDSTHPSPADSLHLILAHDIGRRRFLSQDGDAASSTVGEHTQSTTINPLERGSAAAGGAKARRMLLAAESLLRCHLMRSCHLYSMCNFRLLATICLLFSLFPLLSPLLSSPLLSSISSPIRRSLTVQPVHPEALGLLGEILGEIVSKSLQDSIFFHPWNVVDTLSRLCRAR
jgi:hypothetical protein